MIFGGFAKFVTAILTGDMGGAVDGLKQVFEGLKAYYMTLGDGIVGIFLWASQSIEPVLDGLFSAVGLGLVREGVKTAIGAVPDWLRTAFTDALSVISPIIDAPKWLRDKGRR